jgi:hypothetical protein
MNLCVHEEYAESSYEHMENTLEKSMHKFGKDAKRLLAHSPKTPRDIKLGISQLIMEQNEEKNLDS